MNGIVKHLPEPFALVLDDLHLVAEPAVYLALEYLLDHQPPQMHLVMGTRYDPPLRLARLAARRQLAEIRRSDLGFSRDETNELLNGVLGLGLSTGEITALQERTEGWPAGLCLASGPLRRMGPQSDRSQFMSHVVHSERFALDFLAEEVIRYIPDDLRRFLLETSVLSEMTPSICRALTGREDAGQVLEALYRQNLTIAAIGSEAGGEPIYRHHALLARLLNGLLEREMPGQVAELHRRAAQAERTPGRAIAHYVAARLWDQATRLMVDSGAELLTFGMSETIRNWYKALPADEREKHPRLTVLLGRCEIHRGNYDAAIPLLESAREVFVSWGDVHGEAVAVPSLITLAYQNDDRQAAPGLVDRAFMLPLSPMGKMSALLARAWMRLCGSDWDAVREDLSEALSVLQSTGDRPAALMGVTYLAASPVFAVPGCLELTKKFGAYAASLASPDTALRLGADEIGLWPLLSTAQVDGALELALDIESRRPSIAGYPVLGNDAIALLSVLYLAKGRAKEASDAADELLSRIGGAPRTKVTFYLHAVSRTMALVGRGDKAQVVLNRLRALKDDLPFARYLRDYLEGLIALIDGNRKDASAAIERALHEEETLPVAWAGGSARLLEARLLLNLGRADSAISAASQVLGEWDRGGNLGRVLLDGLVILPVIRRGAQAGDSVCARACSLLADPRTGGTDKISGLADPLTSPTLLTPRERDVLELIVRGLSNRQIGQKLYVTEDTVKSHVAHILRKLDVTSRTQAAVRGREMGL